MDLVLESLNEIVVEADGDAGLPGGTGTTGPSFAWLKSDFFFIGPSRLTLVGLAPPGTAGVPPATAFAGLDRPSVPSAIRTYQAAVFEILFFELTDESLAGSFIGQTFDHSLKLRQLPRLKLFAVPEKA